MLDRPVHPELAVCPLAHCRRPGHAAIACPLGRARVRRYAASDAYSSASPGEGMRSRYHDIMPKQTTVRLPDELADDAEAVARVQGSSVNQLIVDSLRAEIERVRADDEFTARAKRLLERDREILDRLAQ
jgi:hypothetical protein